MKVTNEELKIPNKEQLPEILLRIFHVCKKDPEFPFKENMKVIEEDSKVIEARLEKQKKLYNEVSGMRDELSNKLQLLRQDNFELRSRLLEELGSEI